MENLKNKRVLVEKKMFVWRKDYNRIEKYLSELCWINWVWYDYDGVILYVIGELEDVEISMCVVEGLVKGGYDL